MFLGSAHSLTPNPMTERANPCLRGRAALHLSVQKGQLKSWWSMWGGMHSLEFRC